MAKIRVGELEIAYEIGGRGPLVIFTPGGFDGRLSYSTSAMFGRLTANCQVLIWDRPNIGESTIAATDHASEFHLWADTLRNLIKQLQLPPAVCVGSSGGSVLSLLFAAQYPDLVRGLFLFRHPTNSVQTLKSAEFIDRRYLLPAQAAEKSGMHAALSTGYFADYCIIDDDERKRLESIDPVKVATTLRRWYSWIMSGNFVSANLAESELVSLEVPVAILPGFDDLHPQQSGVYLHSVLPTSQLLELEQLRLGTTADVAEVHEIHWYISLAPLVSRFVHDVASDQWAPST